MRQDFSDKQCFFSTEKLKMPHDARNHNQSASIGSCRMHTLYFHDFHKASADGMLFIHFLVEAEEFIIYCLMYQNFHNNK